MVWSEYLPCDTIAPNPCFWEERSDTVHLGQTRSVVRGLCIYLSTRFRNWKRKGIRAEKRFQSSDTSFDQINNVIMAVLNSHWKPCNQWHRCQKLLLLTLGTSEDNTKQDNKIREHVRILFVLVCEEVIWLLLRSTGDAAKLIWSIESRLREGCPDFSHVTGDGQLQRRPGMGLVHPNRSTCSLFSHSRRVYSHLWRSKLFKILYAWDHAYKVFWTGMIANDRHKRPARPSLSWPSYRLYNLARYTRTCSCSYRDCFRPCVRVGYPGLSSCVMRRSTSLLLENY